MYLKKSIYYKIIYLIQNKYFEKHISTFRTQKTCFFYDAQTIKWKTAEFEIRAVLIVPPISFYFHLLFLRFCPFTFRNFQHKMYFDEFILYLFYTCNLVWKKYIFYFSLLPNRWLRWNYIIICGFFFSRKFTLTKMYVYVKQTFI